MRLDPAARPFASERPGQAAPAQRALSSCAARDGGAAEDRLRPADRRLAARPPARLGRRPAVRTAPARGRPDRSGAGAALLSGNRTGRRHWESELWSVVMFHAWGQIG